MHAHVVVHAKRTEQNVKRRHDNDAAAHAEQSTNKSRKSARRSQCGKKTEDLGVHAECAGSLWV